MNAIEVPADCSRRAICLSLLQRQHCPGQAAGRPAGPAWCRRAEAVASHSHSPCPFGSHSCPQARMCSSCESSPQPQMLMCHCMSVGSLPSPLSWLKRWYRAEQYPVRSRSDAELLSSEEKQERRVQRQV